ncbi:hypothetical protein [Stenotrophomonas cyclobalanopsidis]|uniref:hypothetical protein n=1 Tax=Stenotrophomonas cyclobalanopsidis TaxID=2771362 RepID=UPI0034611C36
MSVDSASHDDVAGLFKRLGTRAGAPHYHDFSDEPATAAGAPRETSPAVPMPAAVETAGPSTEVEPGPLLPSVASVAAAGTPLQQLFQRLAQAPLQDAGQSPLARLRRR